MPMGPSPCHSAYPRPGWPPKEPLSCGGGRKPRPPPPLRPPPPAHSQKYLQPGRLLEGSRIRYILLLDTPLIALRWSVFPEAWSHLSAGAEVVLVRNPCRTHYYWHARCGDYGQVQVASCQGAPAGECGVGGSPAVLTGQEVREDLGSLQAAEVGPCVRIQGSGRRRR